MANWNLRALQRPAFIKSPNKMGATNYGLTTRRFSARTSTGSGLFAHLSFNFEQTFRQIVSMRIKILSHTNSVASRYIKREKSSVPVDVRRSKTSLLNLPIHYHSPLEKREENWAELAFAKTSGVATVDAPVSYWPVYTPLAHLP